MYMHAVFSQLLHEIILISQRPKNIHIFLHKKIHWVLIRSTLLRYFYTFYLNIGFCREIRKIQTWISLLLRYFYIFFLNICFCGEIRKIQTWISLLFGAMCYAIIYIVCFPGDIRKLFNYFAYQKPIIISC